jgi:signal transduction histidine kinase
MNSENKLLSQIKIVPIFILVLSFILSTHFVREQHYNQLNIELEDIRAHFIELQKDIIKKEVNKVYNLINFISNEKSPLYSNLNEEDKKRNILQKIESMKYDKDGYIFIIDYNGNYLSNVKKSLTLENQYHLKDKNNVLLTQEIIKVAKEGEGYLSYISIEGTHQTQSKKISFVKGLKKWNWAIGYGFHPNDIQSEIDKRSLELDQKYSLFIARLVTMNIALTLLFSLLLFWFAKNTDNVFNRYKKEIRQEEDKSREKDEIIFYQSKMASMGELINMISHQWRQPLAQINSLTMDLYMEQKQKILDEDSLKTKIKGIEKTTRYLSNTIDDFSRFFVNEKEKKEFSPIESINECIKLLGPSMKHVTIESNFKTDKMINGYITLYQQVILTIFTNSLDIFEARHIKEPKITIDLYEKDGWCFLEIMDNANGIDEKNLEKIFNLYFSTKNTQNVSGLGLYIAKKIIHTNMDGDIKASNHKDGAKFTIKVKYNEQ